MEPSSRTATTALVILAVLGVLAALYFLQAILIPITLSLLLAALLSPATNLLSRRLRLGPISAAVVLFVLLTVVGLYAASLTAESIIQAANTLPADLERLSLRLSDRVTDLVRAHPFLGNLLPEPGTIDQLGTTHGQLLLQSLSYNRLTDLTLLVGHGVVVLFLVLFLLAESHLLMPRVVRFFANSTDDSLAAERAIRAVTGRIRAYLLTRTALNIGLGIAVAVSLWLMGIEFAVAIGVFTALTNYIPYIGNVAAGSLMVLVTLGQKESVGDAILVGAVFLAIVTVEGYIIMPYVMGRSLDLNGTTVLVACLFWGFLWGLMGLILAMPITVSLKLIGQYVPSLHRWSELMSRDWHPPGAPRSPSSSPPSPPEPISVPSRVEAPHEVSVPKAG